MLILSNENEISFESKLKSFHKNDYALGVALIKTFYGNSEMGYHV